MAADSAYELYLFTNGSWRLQLRLTESEGGKDKAVRLAEAELLKPWVEGAMVVREVFNENSQSFADTKVFKHFKRPDLPTLGGSRRGAPMPAKGPGPGGGRYAAGAIRRASPRDDATASTGQRVERRPETKTTSTSTTSKKEDRSLLTLLSGLANKVADLATDAKPAPMPQARRPTGAADSTQAAVPPPAAQAAKSGVRIGRYDIISELGKGAMGVVYKAYDPVIDRLVAIKTINKQHVDDEGDALSRLRREAQSAGRLSHPNIVAIYDYGENERFAYIAMEFIDGKPLNQIVAQQLPAVPDALHIIRQVLSALDYSHERKVVHRDIKPANIMIMDGGTVKITDFGIARLESSTMTQTGAFMGTPAYMSPEQVKGLVADARSDLFSAGVVLYEILSGQRPFGGSGAALVYQILHTTPAKLTRVPPQLADLVERAIAKEPEERFASARDFLKAIDDVVAKNRTLATGQAADAQKKPWYERWTYEAGRQIFREGDPGDGCYVIETGVVEVLKTDPVTGQEVVLATVGRGTVIGEMALIDNLPRSATVRAKEDTVLLAVPREAFQNRLDKLDPVTRRLLDTFSQRIRALSDEVLRLNVRPGAE